MFCFLLRCLWHWSVLVGEVEDQHLVSTLLPWLRSAQVSALMNQNVKGLSNTIRQQVSLPCFTAMNRLNLCSWNPEDKTTGPGMLFMMNTSRQPTTHPCSSLSPLAPVHHFALHLPRHSRETRLCVCNGREEWGGSLTSNRPEPVLSKSPFNGSVAHSHKSTMDTKEKHRDIYHFFGTVYLGIQSNVDIWEVDPLWLALGACHVEAALLKRSDTAASWSPRPSDLFCFTSLSNSLFYQQSGSERRPWWRQSEGPEEQHHKR